MKRDNFPPFIVLFGVGVVIVGIFAFVLGALNRADHAVPTMAAVTASPVPIAAVESPPPTPTQAPGPSPRATPTQARSPNTDKPAPTVSAPDPATPFLTIEAPEFAPDFSLTQSDGNRFNLTEQLEQGPVVLVFIYSGGG
mgnify:CR=1 FL=1